MFMTLKNRKALKMNDTKNNHLSTKVENVKEKFMNILETGVFEKFENLPCFSNTSVDNIQDYTQYQDQTATHFTSAHSLNGRESRRTLINHGLKNNGLKNNGLKTQNQEIRMPADWNHPGGIQCIGQYLFVPCEKNTQSIVLIYDLANSSYEPVKTIEFNHRAGCLGITDFKYDDNLYYLLIIGDGTRYHIYTSEVPDDGDISKVSFSAKGNFILEKIPQLKDTKNDPGCQGLSLITDTKNNVFMIALYSNDSGLMYVDWGYLMNFKIEKDKITPDIITITGKHLKNKSEVSSILGMHFRWGACIRITPDGRIVIPATGRNIISGSGLNTAY